MMRLLTVLVLVALLAPLGLTQAQVVEPVPAWWLDTHVNTALVGQTLNLTLYGPPNSTAIVWFESMERNNTRESFVVLTTGEGGNVTTPVYLSEEVFRGGTYIINVTVNDQSVCARQMDILLDEDYLVRLTLDWIKNKLGTNEMEHSWYDRQLADQEDRLESASAAMFGALYMSALVCLLLTYHVIIPRHRAYKAMMARKASVDGRVRPRDEGNIVVHNGGVATVAGVPPEFLETAEALERLGLTRAEIIQTLEGLGCDIYDESDKKATLTTNIKLLARRALSRLKK